MFDRSATNGVVLATEKKVQSVLVETKSVEKMTLLTYDHVFRSSFSVGFQFCLCVPCTALMGNGRGVVYSSNIGMTYSGMGPDFRVLTRKGHSFTSCACPCVLCLEKCMAYTGRKQAQQYYLQYKDDIPTSQLVREMAGVAQEFTQSG